MWKHEVLVFRPDYDIYPAASDLKTVSEGLLDVIDNVTEEEVGTIRAWVESKLI